MVQVMQDTASASVSAVAGNTVSAVAGSEAPDAMDMGTVRKAMAWRVKYRVVTESGHQRRKLPLQLLGVHPENRGGVYPQGDVVKTLGIRLAGLGYKQEEADHQGGCCARASSREQGFRSGGKVCAAQFSEMLGAAPVEKLLRRRI